MIKNMLVSFLKDEDGQSLAEYALILALVAVVVIGAVTALGTNINDRFTELSNALQ